MATDVPITGFNKSGSFPNFPLAQDATGTPITSPFTAAKDLVVPVTAVQIHLIQNTGDTVMQIRAKSGSTAVYGTIEVPDDVEVVLPVSGMGCAGYPDKLTVTPGTNGRVSFWFDCTTPTGA